MGASCVVLIWTWLQSRCACACAALVSAPVTFEATVDSVSAMLAGVDAGDTEGAQRLLTEALRFLDHDHADVGVGVALDGLVDAWDGLCQVQVDLPALIVPGQDAAHATSAARYLQECLPRSTYWDVAPDAQTAETVPPRLLDFLRSC